MIIFLLYHFNFKSIVSTLFIMLAMPFTAIGAIWSIKLLGFNKSIAVYAGMMEVIGIGAALCALITTFIMEAYTRWKKENRVKTIDDIYAVITEGASRAL